MTKIKIGIAANEINDSGKTLHHLPISYIPAGYVKGVQLSGGLPFLLPISHPDDAKAYVEQIDKLIMTGGQNINPMFYGETPIFDHTLMNTARDEFELALINEAIRQKKPIFAVCRGMQLLNVALGGTLYQDISQDEVIKHMQAPLERHILTHPVDVVPDSLLANVYGQKTMVNSFHFQALKIVADELRVTATSEDGMVEGVEARHSDCRWIGVQWHPDFAFDVEKKELAMFDFVVNNL